MSTVPPVTSATDTGASQNTSKAASAASVDYNAFLRLLVTQLKNQDPTKPMESTEFVAQLATFSQVEQTISVNKKLDAMTALNALTLADNLIGRSVTSADGEVAGIVASVEITADAPIATLADGRTLTLGTGVKVA